MIAPPRLSARPLRGLGRSSIIDLSPILGVDVGGTFTDFVYVTGGQISITKVLSTRQDPSRAVLAGMERLGVAPDAVISHGTTVAGKSSGVAELM